MHWILLGGMALLVALHVIQTWRVQLAQARQAREASNAPKTSVSPDLSVTVLVPAWQEASVISDTLHALDKVTYPATWDVIVIAGGKDGTLELVNELVPRLSFPCTVMEQQPNGKNAALQQGLQHVTNEVVVILDADTQVSENWLRDVVAPLMQDGVVASCGNFFPAQTTPISMLEQMTKIAAYNIHHQTILQGSGSIAVYRNVLEAVGGFPEYIKVGVDWDLDVRISEKGYGKAFAESAKVVTQRPATLAEFWKNEVRWRRAHMQSLLRQFAAGEGSLLQRILAWRFYIVAFIPLVLLLLIGISALLGFGQVALTFIGILVLFLIWSLGRQSTLPVEISLYTGESHWNKLLPVPALILLVQWAAAWMATLSLRKTTVHFKGPRRV
ncbi:MAG: hypothetical protein CL607_16730 [Anaerolineaceae bacterium]|nr:hypothetical protein [Anaerolineaceae bacterium]